MKSSPADFYRQLFKQACGWLGWTEEQALDSDVIAIQLAMEGRIDMIQAAFFPGQNKKPKVDIATKWKMFAHDHNLTFNGKK